MYYYKNFIKKSDYNFPHANTFLSPLQNSKCDVPFCATIKRKMEQHKLQQRLQQAQLMRRRMAAMNSSMTMNSAVNAAAAANSAPVTPAGM